MGRRRRTPPLGRERGRQWAYLREITGRDITAKDFRTWGGTVLAALALAELDGFDSQAEAKKNLKAAIEQVAARLGNTPTICRRCYVHPEIPSAYLEGALAQSVTREAERARAGEPAGARAGRGRRAGDVAGAIGAGRARGLTAAAGGASGGPMVCRHCESAR